jgi:hypothetical protein
MADDFTAVQHSTGFRMDGKDAYKAYLLELWKMYPVRQVRGNQARWRVYDNNTVVMWDGYADIVFADKTGNMTNVQERGSQIWVKEGGRWQLVSMYSSRMPAGNWH